MGWFCAVLVYILMCKCSLSVTTSIALQEMCVLLGFFVLICCIYLLMETLMCLMIFCIGFVVLYRRYYNITIPIIVYFSVVYFVKLFSVLSLTYLNALHFNAIFIIKCTFKIYLLLHCSVIIMSISI